METSLVVKKEITKVQKCILYFFLYAFLGWLLETIFCIYELGFFQKRGFLYGPLCPIYGYGALMLILMLKPGKGNIITNFLKATIIFTLFEYVVSVGMEALFHQRWWDYTNEFLNINGRVSLIFSLVWGIIALIFIHYIHPAIEKTCDKIFYYLSLKEINGIIIILIIAHFLDTIVSVVRYLPV